MRRDDIVRLIQRVDEVADEEKAERDALRMLAGMFDMNDFHEQIRDFEKMGPELTNIVGDELVRIGAMISSMTDDERRHPELFVIARSEELVFHDRSRLRRVARGSGRTEQEVAALVERHALMRELMIKIGKSTGLHGQTA